MPYHKIKPKKVHRTQTEKFKLAMNIKIKRLETANKILKSGYKMVKGKR